MILSRRLAMGIVSWIIMGLIVGVLAKFIMPGKDPKGCIITVLLGIGGAFVGGFLGSKLGLGTFRGFDFRSLALAVGGAMVLLILYRIVKGK
jgi:uncharacterized membrane protein YeaQ/YmgE (transglycosylase-associated protein family)